MKKILAGFLIISAFLGALPRVVAAAELTWGGYLGGHYVDNRAKKTGTFDPFILSLNTSVRLDENISARAQLDYEHGPYLDTSVDGSKTPGTLGTKMPDDRQSGEIVLSNAYAEYAVADYLKIRGGKFFAPIGFYNQVFYAVPSYPTIHIPNASVYARSGNTTRDAAFYQRYATGLWLTGSRGENVRTSYDLFYSNGRSAEIHDDQNNHKAIGGRLKAALPFAVKVTPMVSVYWDKYNISAYDTPDWRDQESVIPGVEVESGDFDFKAEYAYSDIKKNNGRYDTVMDAFYAEMNYTFNQKVTPFIRVEHIDPDRKTPWNNEREGTLGVAYHLKLWEALLKAQVRRHEYEDKALKAYNVYEAGFALAF